MRSGYSMLQRQSVPMRFAPELRQAVRILQLSTAELHEFLVRETEENPLLDMGADMQPYRWNSGAKEHYDPLLHAAVRADTLESHLMEQIGVIRGLPSVLRRILMYMIGSLDSKGYLVSHLEEIVSAVRVQRHDADQALTILQNLEPAGVGARNLKECLLLQVRRASDCPPLVPILIEEHLHDIAGGRISKLAKRLDAAQEDIQSAIEMIQRLNPKPGAGFFAGETHYVRPDVSITLVGEDLAVRLTSAAALRLTINRQYERMLAGSMIEGEARTFLNEKYQSAKFLLTCLEQRRATLLRVAEAIAEEQAAFFREGPDQLKPMILRTIADRLQLHESTVSRAVSGKYAATPWGVYELKRFFPSGMPTFSGEHTAVESLKRKLQEWIQQENGRKPYSDQQLANLFREDGIPIARRTVAKYREELGIPASPCRKRL